MGSITITIDSNGDIRYSPSPVVWRGDSVTFKLQDIPGQVEVKFDNASCLSPPGPYELNGGSLATSSSQETVTSNADPGPYPFTVTIYGDTARSKLGGDHEVKKGGIDVSTEPPTDPRKK